MESFDINYLKNKNFHENDKETSLDEETHIYNIQGQYDFTSMTTFIHSLFNSFDTPYKLNEDLFSEYAYIVDMDLHLRGRKDDEDTANGKLYGYNMRSVAVLKNKMKDDIDIIYYQLKKSAEKKARRKREI